MATRNEGRDTTSSAGNMGTGGTGRLGKAGDGLSDWSEAGAPLSGVQSHRPSPDVLVGALEADANAEGFAAGERTTELEDGMGDLGSQDTTAVGPDLTPRETEHRGAAPTLINPTHQGTAGIPEEVERLEKEKFANKDERKP